jgi:HEAT repeat protein
LDRQRSTDVRLAAIQALSDLTAATPVLAELAADPHPEISRAADLRPRRAAVPSPSDRLRASAAGMLPSDPAALRRDISRASDSIPISALQQIVEHVRMREGTEPARRTDWMAVRGAAHAALAQRGSRIALYDLRETIESARQPVPGEFLAALTKVGDASCLEAIAAAYTRAGGTALVRDDWWRRHLGEAFRAIVDREKTTRRHGVIRNIGKRWKVALDELWPGRTSAAGKFKEPGRSGGAGKAGT